jgi:hypothetical protein
MFYITSFTIQTQHEQAQIIPRAVPASHRNHPHREQDRREGQARRLRLQTRYRRYSAHHSELLTKMFPTVEWDNEGKHFKQNISTNPPSREDVNSLQKLLDEKLVVRQARYSPSDAAIQGFAPLGKNCTSNASTKSSGKSQLTLPNGESC